MFLDLKLGILWAVLVGFVFGEPITFLWILAGILFALLPDIDFWIELAERGTVGGKTLGAHRTLLHNPLPWIPVVILIGVFSGPAWMTLATLGIFGHFVHDTMGMGFGVRWLWPYRLNFYKIFSDAEGNIHYDRHHLRPVSWTPEALKKVIAEKGNDHWLEEDLAYAKRHAWSILFKLVTLIFGLVLLKLFIDRFS